MARHRARRRPRARAPALRLRVPGVRAVPAPARVAERRLSAARRRPRASGGGARWSCSSASGSRTSPTRARGRSRAASASASRSRARWRAGRRRCCSTSRCRRSTPARAPRGGRELAAVLAETGVPALLVTHDFTEAALLGDRVGVIDGGPRDPGGHRRRARRVARVGVRGRLHRRRRADRHRRTRSRTGSPRWRSTAAARCSAPSRATGPVAVSVYPWEIALVPGRHASARGSAQNHLAVAGRLGHRRRQPRPRRARRPAAADRGAQRRLGDRARPDPGRARGRDLEGGRDPPAAPLRSAQYQRRRGIGSGRLMRAAWRRLKVMR